jgi:hypothetical protein
VFQPSIFHFTAQSNCCSKLGNGDSRPAYSWSSFLLGRFKSSGEEDFPKQVTQGDVTAALEGEVDTALDKIILTSRESGIEARQIGFPNATAERGEEGTETWIRAQEVGGRQCMGCQKMTWD